MVFKNFQEFIVQKTLNEATGKSSMEFSVASSYQGLYVLLTLVQDGDAQKARVLNWIMGEGLMNASLNREKLLEDVKAVISGFDSTIDFPKSSTNKVAMMKAEAAREAGNIWGLDSDLNDITVHDLFSPEARVRIPILKQIDEEKLMPGKKNLFQFWFDKYEPKYIMIDDGRETNSHSVYDLQKMRQLAESKGLMPFYYGGENGLIQFIEKGDWLPDHQKGRSLVNHNDQDGPDISPEKTTDPKTGKERILDDVKSFDRSEGKARPIYHFQGGSYAEDTTRSLMTINGMQEKFKEISHKIENKEEKDIDPQTKKDIEDFSKIKDFVDREESELEDKDFDIANQQTVRKKRGVEGFAKQLGVFKATAGTDLRKIPVGLNVDKLTQLIQLGLSFPFGIKNRQNRRSFNSMNWMQSGMTEVFDLINVDNGQEVVNQEILNSTKDLDGWFYIVPNTKKVIFKFSQAQQKYLFEKIFLPQIQGGVMPIRSRLHNEKEKDSPFKSLFIVNNQGQESAIAGAHNSKILLSSIIENALENNESLRDAFKVVNYKIKGIDPKAYTFTAPSTETELPDVNIKSNDKAMGSAVLNKLAQKGFDWLNLSEDSPNPFVNSDRDGAIFTNGKERYLVTKRLGPDGRERFYLSMPEAPDGLKDLQSRSARSYGTGGRPVWGSHDIAIKGGKFGGHISGNALGKQDWAKVRERLLRGCGGGLAEGDCRGDEEQTNTVVYRNELELPSVRGGVEQAKRNFDRLASNFAGFDKKSRPSDFFDPNELMSWGVEGLHLYSNDRAYQVGWISEAEYANFIGNFSSKGVKKNKKTDLEKEFIKQDVLGGGNWEWDDEDGFTLDDILKSTRLKNSKKGFGVLALLNQFGAIGDRKTETPEDRAELQNLLLDKIKQLQKETSKENSGMLLIDKIRQVSPLAGAALAKNGFEFRKRRIGQFVLKKMRDRIYELQKNPTMGFQTGGTTATGEPAEMDPTIAGVQARTRLRNSTGVSRQRLTQDELQQLQQGTTPVQPRVAAQSGARVATTPATPRIAASQPDVDFGGVDLSSIFGGVQPKQQVPVAKKPSQAMKPNPVPQIKQSPVQEPNIDFGGIDLGSVFESKSGSGKLMSFSQWKKNLKEMVGTYAIVNPDKKPKDGDGFNIWGAAGRKGGVSIAGEANDSEQDPVGEKGRKRERRTKRGRK